MDIDFINSICNPQALLQMSMQDSLETKLKLLAVRLLELSNQLTDEEIMSDLSLYAKLSKEYAELSPIVNKYNEYISYSKDLVVANEMLADPDSKDFAYSEIGAINTKLSSILDELNQLLLPKDPNDEKNIFLEIRAGAGGDESALFAVDLLRMYTRFAERNGWKIEMISDSSSELGGAREVIIRIIGKGAYSKLKFESGAHRVQRIPVTESQGRIHTSTCTVAVMPEADELSDIVINPSDLRIDTFRASGAGGQHINKTDSAIRITHIPSGVVVECQDDRSQHRNKARALSVLTAKLKAAEINKQHAETASLRKNLIGSGDRSERIRTYNFPQNRVTDHRIHLTLHKLEAVMNGDLFELTTTLYAEHQAQILASNENL
jgi:peptide chain release factor 1